MPKKHRDKDADVILTDNTLKETLNTLIDKRNIDKDTILSDDNTIHTAEIVDRIDTLPFSHNYKTGKLDNGTQSTPPTPSHSPHSSPSTPSQIPSIDPSLLASPVSHSAPGDWNEVDLGSPLEKQSSLPPILQGFEVPTKKSGPWKSNVDIERWRNVCEGLLGRNVKNAHQISKLTGLSNHQAIRFVKEIRESWQSDLTPQRVNLRREKLYSENERISDFCWQMIQADPTSRDVPQYLKIIGDTNTRRGRLIGAENITIQTKEIEQRELNPHELSISTAKKLGVSLEVLKALGDDLSGNMNEDGGEG